MADLTKPSVVARRNRVVDGRPVIDFQLAEIGAKLKDLTIRYGAMGKLIRDLQFEQDIRLQELRKERHLEVYDAGDAWGVVNNNFLTEPTEHQKRALSVFQAALDRSPDQFLLTEAYKMCIEYRCEFTTWQSSYGENLEIAYARRMGELAA